MRAVDVKGLTALVLHSRGVIHSTLCFVVNSVRTYDVLCARGTFVYLLLRECWLVEPVKVFRVDRELKVVDWGFLRNMYLELKPAIVNVCTLVENGLPLALLPRNLRAVG